MVGCSKCACKKFSWNPVSAFAAWKERFGRPSEQKGSASVGVNGISVSFENKIEYVSNSSNALRNCLCGHLYNYHN